MYNENPYITKTEAGFYVLEECPKCPPYLSNEHSFEIKNINLELLEKLIDLCKQNKVLKIPSKISVYVYDKEKYNESIRLDKEYYLNYEKYNQAKNLIIELNKDYNIPEEFSNKLIDLQRKIDDLEKENEFLREKNIEE